MTRSVDPPAAQAPGLPTGDDDLSALVRVHVWAYPLVLVARLRQTMTSARPPDDPATSRSAAAPMNTFGHQRLLSDASYRVGVAPNVDTLYSVAWVDLAEGPVVLESPDFGGRYYTFQVGFADSSSTAVGHRTHGGRLPLVTLRAEGSPEPPLAALHLTSPLRYVMLAGRILVDAGDDVDLGQVHRLQDQVRLSRWRDGGLGPCSGPEQAPVDFGTEDLSDGPAFRRRLADVLADWQPVALPPDIAADLRRAGFDSELRPRSTVDAALLQSAVAEGTALIEQGVRTTGTQCNHWSINYRGSQFGNDWLLRAAVAHSAIFVNPAAEALYAIAELDAEGRPLSGSRSYQISLDRPPPVSFFWSLTMYHDRGFLVDNPIARYAIGDRSPDLRPEQDGRLVIDVSHAAPTHGTSNWLPAPPGGFRLMLRLYGPSAECLEGRWSPPRVVDVTDAGNRSGV